MNFRTLQDVGHIKAWGHLYNRSPLKSDRRVIPAFLFLFGLFLMHQTSCSRRFIAGPQKPAWLALIPGLAQQWSERTVPELRSVSPGESCAGGPAATGSGPGGELMVPGKRMWFQTPAAIGPVLVLEGLQRWFSGRPPLCEREDCRPVLLELVCSQINLLIPGSAGFFSSGSDRR